MHIAPLPAIIHHPWFLADVPEWRNDGTAPGETFESDGLYLEEIFLAKVKSQQLPSYIASLLHNSGERLFFQSAFHVKGIHEEFVRLHCSRTKENLVAARLQLDQFVFQNPELREASVETSEWVSREMKRMV
ncbi:hypothetical protein VHEMI03866 [[Torrubiella] hemipterigena]|uniref:Uncharacterized protein n=1 Tax=[Torrubiella] hemipterigena TaxID=1531966 RepID=A0A0A1SZN3_9HYPO|nr:hypothetical protein VHEMI03866 [[Torrubiella] hemipterigena]